MKTYSRHLQKWGVPAALLCCLLTIPSKVWAEASDEKFEGLLNKMLAPGPMMQGHADLEHTGCLKCHEAGAGIPNKNCLACHKPISQAIQEGKGYHKHSAGKNCASCHPDHHGRDADTTRVDENGFDHNVTGFSLDGAHANLACSECHKTPRTGKLTRKTDPRYFGTSASCRQCHGKDNIHEARGRFATSDCNACHSTQDWRTATPFDHEKETGYRLEGKHQTLACKACHETGGGHKKYHWPDLASKKCLACHRNHHGKNLGDKFRNGDCTACHRQQTWHIDSFNHAVTSFSLQGKHTKLDCIQCHKQPDGATSKDSAHFVWNRLDKQCSSCHQDYHGYGGGMGRKLGRLNHCEQCHGEAAWKPANFNHNSNTEFPLSGKHQKVACFSCHKAAPGNQQTSKKQTQRIYNFPDLAVKSCGLCHQSPHGPDFFHRFGSRCEKCHSTQGFKGASPVPTGGADGKPFSHDATRFPLTGKHVGVSCKDCHVKNGHEVYTFPELPVKSCQLCHVSPHDAVFQQNFGTRCANCHSTQSFKDAKLPKGAADQKPFSHDQTRFPLTGKHREVTCRACHIKNGVEVYKFPDLAKKSCMLCHKSPHDTSFQKRFGTRCADCHSTETFQKPSMPTGLADGRREFSHDKTRFPLTDKHREASCNACHIRDGKPVFHFPELPAKSCLLCHKSPHNSAFRKKFGAQCSACHNARSWSDASLIKNKSAKTFNHAQTRFPLTGHHTGLSCQQCHVKDGREVYRFAQTKGEFCSDCHQDVHRQQFDANFAQKPCSTCHTTTDFAHRKPFDHHTTTFELTGAHQKIARDCGKCHLKTASTLPTHPPKAASRFLFNRDPNQRCAECHVNEHTEMFHKDFYNKPCSACHTVDAFLTPTHFRHDATAFPLKGKHLQVSCTSCHVKTAQTYRAHPAHRKGRYIFTQLVEKSCATCHADPHKGSHGTACNRCHSEEGWRLHAGDYHKDFKLTGVHLALACEQCHGKSHRVLKGASDNCLLCHHKDDSHRGGLPDCGECHTQTAWEFTRFDHSMTQFPLKGAHRVASCDTCHRGGVYQGLSTQCADCHARNAGKVKNPDHSGAAFQNCEQCHNEFSF